MHRTEPKIFLVGETAVDYAAVGDYLSSIGAGEWSTAAWSDGEYLVEFMGRVCYRSFAPGLNPNVTRVREGNDKYLANILSSKHGSVLEHSWTNWVFADVSRVFTHELARHRVGTAISQESLRFVRLDNLGLWAPTVIQNDEEALQKFVETFEHLEQLQLWLAEHFGIDANNFNTKKEITSAMRRIAPIGVATTVGWSANFRALRHLIEVRTEAHAEEEIRLVFARVAAVCLERWPNVFQDFSIAETVNGISVYKPEYSKV